MDDFNNELYSYNAIFTYSHLSGKYIINLLHKDADFRNYKNIILSIPLKELVKHTYLTYRQTSEMETLINELNNRYSLDAINKLSYNMGFEGDKKKLYEKYRVSIFQTDNYARYLEIGYCELNDKNLNKATSIVETDELIGICFERSAMADANVAILERLCRMYCDNHFLTNSPNDLSVENIGAIWCHDVDQGTAKEKFLKYKYIVFYIMKKDIKSSMHLIGYFLQVANSFVIQSPFFLKEEISVIDSEYMERYDRYITHGMEDKKPIFLTMWQNEESTFSDNEYAISRKRVILNMYLDNNQGIGMFDSIIRMKGKELNCQDPIKKYIEFDSVSCVDALIEYFNRKIASYNEIDVEISEKNEKYGPLEEIKMIKKQAISK